MAILAWERGAQTRVLKIKVKNGDEDEKEGYTVHQDISIAASPPSTGQKGWIVLKGGDKIQEKFKNAIEIIDK